MYMPVMMFVTTICLSQTFLKYELIDYSFVPIAAYFNHDCNPNTTKRCNTKREFEFRTVRDVKEGEELTIYYGNPTTLDDREVATRRKRLRQFYHFYCTCKRCTHENNEM